MNTHYSRPAIFHERTRASAKFCVVSNWWKLHDQHESLKYFAKLEEPDGKGWVKNWLNQSYLKITLKSVLLNGRCTDCSFSGKIHKRRTDGSHGGSFDGSPVTPSWFGPGFCSSLHLSCLRTQHSQATRETSMRRVFVKQVQWNATGKQKAGRLATRLHFKCRLLKDTIQQGTQLGLQTIRNFGGTSIVKMNL